MQNQAPHDPWKITIATSRDDIEAPGAPAIRGALTLRQLLDKYSVTLGFQNAHLLEVLITLMTTGKVRVEFRTYTERLQVSKISDMLTKPTVIELFNEYLVSSKEAKISTPDVTRRITVQLPKISRESDGTKRRAPPTP